MSDSPDPSRYFDNAATTPLDPRVLREMLPFLEGDFGNAHSLHSFGQRARHAVDLARERVARLIQAEDPSQITFNSGATEGNNTVIRSAGDASVSPFEHSSVRETAELMGFSYLENQGLELLPPCRRPELISLMAVNNEIGTIWNPGTLSRAADAIHSDITQAAGKIPCSLDGIEYATFSAHKFYGPKGIGALYCRSFPPKPLLTGGEQENGIRSGTLNVPGIVGMGGAALLAYDEMDANLAHAQKLRSIILDGLEGLSDWQAQGGQQVSPYILSLSFASIEGETLVVELDRLGFAISSGAACSSRSTEPSHVLTALNLPKTWLRGTVRVSFGRFCSAESAQILSQSIRLVVERLRSMK